MQFFNYHLDKGLFKTEMIRQKVIDNNNVNKQARSCDNQEIKLMDVLYTWKHVVIILLTFLKYTHNFKRYTNFTQKTKLFWLSLKFQFSTKSMSCQGLNRI